MSEPRIRLLLVEDEGIIALAGRLKLESLGIDVVGTASTGTKACEIALQLRPDIILMDIKLKGEMSGIEAVRAIHREVYIPVLYTSAYDDKEIIELAASTRHEGIISKPVEFEDLLTRLHRIKDRSRQEKDRSVPFE